jgi:hypothetical protein
LLYHLDVQVKIQGITAEQNRVATPRKLNATHDKEFHPVRNYRTRSNHVCGCSRLDEIDAPLSQDSISYIKSIPIWNKNDLNGFVNDVAVPLFEPWNLA